MTEYESRVLALLERIAVNTDRGAPAPWGKAAAALAPASAGPPSPRTEPAAKPGACPFCGGAFIRKAGEWFCLACKEVRP